MEDQTAQAPIQSEVPPTPESKKNTPVIIGIALFVVIILAGLYAWQTNPSKQIVLNDTPLASPTTQNSSTDPSVILTFEPLEGSNDSGFGFTTSDTGMYVISTDPESLQTTSIDDGAEFSVVTVGLGESAISTSPDGKYIAYQTKDNRLTLLSTDNTQKITLSPQLRVESVGPWSPDSKRVIVYSNPKNLPGLFEGMGEPEETVTFEKGLLPKGYYLVDAEAGTVVALTPITSFSGWVDKSRILTSLSDSNIDSQTLMVFDVDHFTADTNNLLPSTETFFSLQKTVNFTGTKWALTAWPQGKDVDDIYTFIADFPQTSGKIIANGIKTQNPLISPDGKSVLFHTQDEQNGPRFVEFWQDDETTRVGEGIPLRWINDKQFLYSQMSEQASTNTTNHLQKIFIYNVNNGQSQELFSL